MQIDEICKLPIKEIADDNRQNPEILLIGVKGKVKKGVASTGEHCVYNGRIEEHSKKPDYIRRRIPYLVENGENLNKLELFARQKTEGWDVWGNEVESDIVLDQPLPDKQLI